jgi:hypothetical protein
VFLHKLDNRNLNGLLQKFLLVVKKLCSVTKLGDLMVPYSISRQTPDPPHFSLPTTFNQCGPCPKHCCWLVQNVSSCALFLQTPCFSLYLGPVFSKLLPCFFQGCGSGLDPDSIGSVDPDSESGSGSRRAKMTHKRRKF